MKKEIKINRYGRIKVMSCLVVPPRFFSFIEVLIGEYRKTGNIVTK